MADERSKSTRYSNRSSTKKKSMGRSFMQITTSLASSTDSSSQSYNLLQSEFAGINSIDNAFKVLTEEELQHTDLIIEALKKFRLTDCNSEQVCEMLANSLRERKDVSKLFSHFFICFFDFAEISLISALRKFSRHVFIQGETQVVDLILKLFSEKYFNDNPASFPSKDVTHTVVFAILLLNTDFLNSETKQTLDAFKTSVNLATEGQVDDYMIAEIYKSLSHKPIEPVKHHIIQVSNLKRYHDILAEEHVFSQCLYVSRISTISKNPLLFYEVGKKESLFSNRTRVQMFIFPTHIIFHFCNKSSGDTDINHYSVDTEMERIHFPGAYAALHTTSKQHNSVLIYQNCPEKAIFRISHKDPSVLKAQEMCDRINFYAALCTRIPFQEQMEQVTVENVQFPFHHIIDINPHDSAVERLFKKEAMDNILNRLLILLQECLAGGRDETKDKQTYLSREMQRIQTYMQALNNQDMPKND